MKYRKYIILMLFIIFPTNVIAQEKLDPPPSKKDKAAIITLSFENDTFIRKDNNYTNGVRIGYISSEEVPNWIEKSANLLPIINTTGAKRWGFAMGQSIFTPNDINLANPPLNDRPYAGWLYGTAILISDNDITLDTFQVTLGMVGPSSLAGHKAKTLFIKL